MKACASALALAAALGAVPPPVTAQDAELEQRIRIIERKLEVNEEDKQKTTTTSAGDKSFGFKNADGSFEFKFKGLLQVDGRFFSGDEQAFKDSWLVRRMEPTFEFTLGKLAFFKLQPQFAGDAATTSDVYGELRFDPAVGLRFGKFKTPLALEYLQGSGALAFIERGLPTEVGAGRDLGVQLQGDLFGGAASYAVAWVDGAPDGRDAAASDTDARKEMAARLFFEPFKADAGFWQNLGFGIAGTTGRKTGATTTTAGVSAATGTGIFNNTLPRYRSPGQNTVFQYRSNATPTDADTVIAAGNHTRWSPQLYYYRNGFGLLAEYIVSQQEVSLGGVSEELEHSAWQGVVSYVLTGEPASYRGVKPAVPYASGGGWGAFEVALRYGTLDVDDAAFPIYANPDTAVSELSDFGLGFNWYLTGNARISMNYDRTTFDGGAAAGTDRNDEKAIFTRLQVSF